ncbi:MAG: hypothetical protein JNK63_09905 [Chthonomonas sp.]|nr:hypothetical protein [Chthonomonas sp.]
MQLCRFVLREEPEGVRSGLFHDGRFFETDGERPVGVYDPGKVGLLAPMQSIPSLRVFNKDLSYTYRNSAVFGGPLMEVDAPGLDCFADVRIVAILKDDGEQITSEEADAFILGYSLLIALVTGSETDFPFALGPFLTIPEGPAEALLAKPLAMKINGDELFAAQLAPPDFPAMIERASRTNRATTADVLAAPPIEVPSHKLKPGDSVQVAHEGLGILSIKVV